MITDFKSFFGELTLESIINESIIYYSKDTRRVLNRLRDNQIAKDLLSIEATDIKPDITFVNLDKEGYLSFTTMKNAIKNIADKYPHLSYMDHRPDRSVADELWDLKDSSSGAGIYDKSRNSLKIGKLVNKIFPGKYPDKEVEEFVNKFKAAIEGGEVFELVEGKDIDFWYDSKNYLENKGTLGSSCMKEKSGIFDIYTENPEVCKMLILKEDDKLIGRALVWKLNSIKRINNPVEGAEWFMDRQYTINDSDVEKFRNFAKDKGWAYKSRNNHHSFEPIIFAGEEFNAILEVQVKQKNYRRYPYMDTFRRYDPNTGALYNDDSDDEENEGQYILGDTGGGYEEIEGGVWSEWYDRRIPHDEAVWSDWADSYLDRDRAIYVERGSRRWRDAWYPDDCDDIVYDEWIDEYIHGDDAVYSEAYGYYLFDDNAVRVIEDVYEDGEIDSNDNWMHKNDNDITELYPLRRMSWYKFLVEKFSEWEEYDYILKTLLVENSDDKLIPKVLKRKVYRVTEPKSGDSPDIMGIEYLLREDAIALDWDVNYADYKIKDIIEYNLNIEEIIGLIKDKLDTKLSELDRIISGEGRMKFEDEETYISKIGDLKRELMTRYDELESEKFHEDLS